MICRKPFRTVRLVLVALSLAHGISPWPLHAIAKDVISVKLGFSALSPADEKALWERAEAYANLEHRYNDCGGSTNFEARFVEAVKDCVEPEALEKVRQYYRRKYKEGSFKPWISAEDRAGSCRFFMRWIYPKWKAEADHVISEAKRMCKSCLIC